jgi:DNA-binding CsgD family transcriptional regulator
MNTETIQLETWNFAGAVAAAMLSGDAVFEEKTLSVRGQAEFVAYCHTTSAPDGTPTRIVVISGFNSMIPGIADLRSRFNLTNREAEIALLLCERRSNKEIARLKGFTTHAAERHTEKILAKLGIGSRKDVLQVLQRNRSSAPTLRRPA